MCYLNAQVKIIEWNLNVICLQIGVMSCLIYSSPCKRQRPCVSSNFLDDSALHGYKCTSDICLRTCRGHSSHSSEVSVCRGLGPHPWVTSADFSHTYLPVKSFIPLITGQWLYQQTASGVFLHAFTQIKWIIVLVDFGASFLM